MPLQLVVPATAHAFTLAETKLFLRVDLTDDDALITSFIAAAEQEAEHIMGRALLPQQWQLTLDQFGSQRATWDYFNPYPNPSAAPFALGFGPSLTAANAVVLQRPTVTAVNSVKYIDAASGQLTTLASTEYQLANASDYAAYIVPAYGKAWPGPRVQPEAVQIVFTAGYPDAASVPEPIKAWLRLRIGALYEQREAWTRGTHQALNRNEFLDYLLDRYRVWSC